MELVGWLFDHNKLPHGALPGLWLEVWLRGMELSNFGDQQPTTTETWRFCPQFVAFLQYWIVGYPIDKNCVSMAPLVFIASIPLP